MNAVLSAGSSGRPGSGDHLWLVDGSAFIFRAYHALPPLTRRSDGHPMGAVSGFCNMLWKLLRQMGDSQVVTHLAVIFDAPGSGVRHQIYPAYKANRSSPPEDLVAQFSFIRGAVEAFSVASVEQEGVEADDILATYAHQAALSGAHVSIISSDKDLMQLISDRISMYDPMKDQVINRQAVIEKFGVMPEQMADFQALVGDSSDNVPGIPGIGPKTASELIRRFGNLEEILAQVNEVDRAALREKLTVFQEQARLSYRLVYLDRAISLPVSLDSFALRSPDAQKLIGFLKAAELDRLSARVSESLGFEEKAIAPDPRFLAVPKQKGQGQNPEDDKKSASATGSGGSLFTPCALAGKRQAEEWPIRRENYECITTVSRLHVWIEKAFRAGIVAVDTETDSLNPVSCNLVGISLAIGPSEACYIPLAHHVSEMPDLGLEEGDVIEQIPLLEAIALLKPLLEAPGIIKVGQNLKYDYVVLMRHAVNMVSCEDTMLMSCVLDGGKHGHGLDELSRLHLRHVPISFREVTKGYPSFDFVPIDEATVYAAEDADLTLRLYQKLKTRLVCEGCVTVYENLERPMIRTLADMECAGIFLDMGILRDISEGLTRKLSFLDEALNRLAGQPFNPASPKQVGELLFEKMGFPFGKKTKTGGWGTGAEVLEELSVRGYEFPTKLLEWRQLSKLRSTYTDALPHHVNPKTGRVHTSYSLAGTVTGRLSSSDPNLQNIPIRSEEGLRIRSAFRAASGHKLVSADYSQMELRVLAHMADSQSLQEIFAKSLDVHTMTAAEIFGIPAEEVSAQERRQAKAINFGIIYGMSAFGLAAQLGVPREEAARYIAAYFERFPDIQVYMERTKAFCHQNGFVETLFGRRIHYPEISTSKGAVRGFLERAAINAPIQGSASDIIRRAMVRMKSVFEKAGIEAKMLMQVHDELVFEVPEDFVEQMTQTVRHMMETAAQPALDLRVPLIVEVKVGDNWAFTH